MDASISRRLRSDHLSGKHILGDIIDTSEEQGLGVVKGVGEHKRQLGEELITSTTHRCRIPLQHGLGVGALLHQKISDDLIRFVHIVAVKPLGHVRQLSWHHLDNWQSSDFSVWHFGSLLGPHLYFRVLIFTILVSFTQRMSIQSACIHICRHRFRFTLLANFDFDLCLRINFHTSSFWVLILAAWGPYWVLISKLGGLYQYQRQC